MPAKQLAEVAELENGEVGCQRGLFAFFADDANADVGSLDHADVVATVANAADALASVVADEAGDIGFLGG